MIGAVEGVMRIFNDGDRVKISVGTYEYRIGRVGVVIAEVKVESGKSWTGVLWDGEEDPDWFKTALLEIAK